MKTSAQFQESAIGVGHKIDFLVGALGTDVELIDCEMAEMTRKYGDKVKRVRPEHWKLMSAALVSTLEETLGEARFDKECRESWETAFDALSEKARKQVKQ